MLYKRLKDLYSQNKVLAAEYPFDEYYLLLQNFITREVSLGAEYLSPYRFALFYSKSPKDIIRWFLGLSDSEEIIEQLYKYQCEECGTINILKNEKSLFDFKCYECGEEESLTRKDYLSEVKLLFKINEELLEEVEENLKINPLSNETPISSAVLEGEKDIDIDIDVSLETAEDVVYKNGIPISQAQKERSDRINRCRELLG
ncbi:hypothetical protein ACQVST_28465 [Bacillus cereus]|nr:hypothetical protein [Bacillus cereus]MCC2447037.1 hypothetical protein [Bacillus cereus]MCU5479603.1 hypothetical protein [Bacillus cereus]MCU5618002.1 hypothetical protein [Bacillus cereus]MDK7481693.1 hypothetical protein [Bacillus cereus]QUW29240.1 hypothetical protein J8Y16_26975 [Bacillus cereus]